MPNLAEYSTSCKKTVPVWESSVKDQEGCLNSSACCAFFSDALLSPLNIIYDIMLFITGFFVAVTIFIKDNVQLVLPEFEGPKES